MQAWLKDIFSMYAGALSANFCKLLGVFIVVLFNFPKFNQLDVVFIDPAYCAFPHL